MVPKLLPGNFKPKLQLSETARRLGRGNEPTLDAAYCWDYLRHLHRTGVANPSTRSLLRYVNEVFGGRFSALN